MKTFCLVLDITTLSMAAFGVVFLIWNWRLMVWIFTDHYPGGYKL